MYATNLHSVYYESLQASLSSELLSRLEILLLLKAIAYLGACIDGMANVESARLVEQYAIEEVALSAAVHTSDREHANRALKRLQKLACFLIDFEL